jgi:hypothetical protein
MRIDHNFLFEHTGTSPDALLHDQVLHTASQIAVGLLIATAVVLGVVAARRRALRERPSPQSLPVIPLAILTAGIAFLLTPLGLPIWNHAPQAAFLQFPWRLLAVVAPVLALAVAAAFGNLSRKSAGVAAFVLAAAFALPAYHAFRQQCYPEDMATAQFAAFQSHAGVDPTDEYTPTNADNGALKTSDPPYWLATSPEAPAPIATQPGPAPARFTLTAPRAEDLVLNLRKYPAWQVFLNGTLDPAREQRDDGLIALPITAGTSTVEIRYAHTADQTAGDILSLAALLILAWLQLTHRAHALGGRPAL